MDEKYEVRLGNKLNTYTTYEDGKELTREEVLGLLEKSEKDDEQPDYYAGNGSSPIDCFMEGLMSPEETIGFFKGNVIKYVIRCGKKKDNSYEEDIRKAKDYLDKLLEMDKFK